LFKLVILFKPYRGGPTSLAPSSPGILAHHEHPHPAPEREIFCNRTLNLRAIEAVGYDMDYTLIHYKEEAWEQRAYEHLRRSFVEQGWPVEQLRFDPEMMERGLVLDIELGNILEANRFGFVKQACHGTARLPLKELREAYARTMVELAKPRYVFLNTLFSLSEGVQLPLLHPVRLPPLATGLVAPRRLSRGPSVACFVAVKPAQL